MMKVYFEPLIKKNKQLSTERTPDCGHRTTAKCSRLFRSTINCSGKQFWKQLQRGHYSFSKKWSFWDISSHPEGSDFGVGSTQIFWPALPLTPENLPLQSKKTVNGQSTSAVTSPLTPIQQFLRNIRHAKPKEPESHRSQPSQPISPSVLGTLTRQGYRCYSTAKIRSKLAEFILFVLTINLNFVFVLFSLNAKAWMSKKIILTGCGHLFQFDSI